MQSRLILLGLALAVAGIARADFTPIALNPASFNHDVVVENTAPRSLSDAVNATMDGGTNKSGNTWFEVGYWPGQTNGLPAQNSFVTNATLDHVWRMPPDYHVNNVVLVGHNGGAGTPVVTTGTLTLTTPAAYSALSFLNSSGNGPVLVGYVVHYADSTTESNVFSSLDWFNAAAPVYIANGRVSVSGGGLQSVNNNPLAPRLFQWDVPLAAPAVNVTSVDFYYVGSGGNNNPNNNGRAVIFAIAGSTDSVNFNPVVVTGFNYDVVVEADGPPTTTQVGFPAMPAAASAPTNNITATMDGGKSKTSNVWYEKGYYAAFPNTGIPTAGSSLTSSALPSISYTMPPSYTTNCAFMVSSNETTANIVFSSPAPYRALSFLCGAANGDTIVPCILSFSDGTTETNAILVRDWFTRTVPYAYLAFGRVLPLNRSLNNTPDQFVNPYVNAYPGPLALDFRVGHPVPRLFDSILYVTNSVGSVTNIALSYTNGINTRVVSIFAVSGSSSDTIPPVFGVAGSTATGQPGVRNDVTRVKPFEGTNNIVLTSSLIAGTQPVSYQWMRAPRGGGLRDINYGFNYATFANVVDGGRISGATSNNLVISNAVPADDFDYLVVASNAYGMATSTVATVMVLTTNEDLILSTDPIVSSSGEGSPANQGIAQAINHVVGNVDPEKWLSYGLQGGNNTTLPFTGPVGFIVTPSKGQSVVKAIRFYTANDTQGRDPYDYFLEGSNDGGGTWSPITGGILQGTLSLPTGRNNSAANQALTPSSQNVVEVDFANAAGYRQYRFTITNNIDQYRQASMQIGEIQLLGSLVPNPPAFTRQPPPNVRVFVGASPVFGVSAIGYPLPRYQWLTNGVPAPSATNSSYTFPNAQLADSGRTFSCIASNVFGTTNSTSATLTVIAAPTQPYPSAVLGDGPIAYWRLNESPDNGTGNNGTAANDYRGGHVGEYSNAVIAVNGYNSSADSDTAAQFGVVAPSDSMVHGIQDISFAASNLTVNFSVEAWVNGAAQTTAGAGIITKGGGGGGEQFCLDCGGANNALRFFYRDAAGVAHLATSSRALDGNWHHVVGVCDQANGSVILYVDGIQAASGTAPALNGALNTPSPVTIGARQGGAGTAFNLQFTGVIDDAAIYNYALSPGQILSHYYGGQFPPVITLQPTSLTAAENVSVTFSTFSYGSGTLSYQWYLSDGANPTAPVSGQTASNLTFTTTAAQNNNFYQLVVTNGYGAATSSVAQLTVVSGPPSFLVDLPSSDTFLVGHVIQLRVEPGGTAPFTYQWQKNSVNISDNYRISGSHTNVLVIAYANFSDTGNYQVLVSGQGTTPSALDAVTVTNVTALAPFTAAGTGWSLQGSTPPIMSANRLELTSGLGNTARSAFLNDKQSVATFNASFVYQDVSGAGGADGVTFCIQNAPAGAAALGGGGGGLGYSGITVSFALGLNIYDPNTRGVRFLQNGALPAAGAGAFMPITPVLVGGNANPIQVNVSYAGGVASATFRDLAVPANTFTTNITVDIPAVVGSGAAYIGFTGADGGVASTQIISNFTMVPPPVTLKAQRVGDSLVLSWPASAGAVLRSTPTLTSPVWSDVTAQFQLIGNQGVVTVSPLTGIQFYRLDVYP